MQVEDMRKYKDTSKLILHQLRRRRSTRHSFPRAMSTHENVNLCDTHYAPINTPRSHILEEALQVDLIPLRRKFQSLPNADMNKYCRYHHNNDHTTDECMTLKDKVEELIRVTHLRNFVKREDEEASKVKYRKYDDKRDKRRDRDKYERREKPLRQDDR